MSMTIGPKLREYHLAEIEQARQKRNRLGPASHVGAALSDDVLDEVRKFVETSSEADLMYGHWPYIFCFVLSKSEEALAEFDADVDLILQNTTQSRKNSVTKFLRTRDPRTGVWFGGLFEVWSKATFLKRGADPRLDVALANGRDHDVSAIVGTRRFHFECTALTEDDESREVWDRFMEHKKLDPKNVLVRPGPFCPPNAKGPSPYYLTLRLYAKAYDKLTMNLDPARSQFVDHEPNLLLTRFAGPHVSSDHPGVHWGFEELFADNPKMARAVVPEGFTDISLDAWADIRANELIAQRMITIDWYCENSNHVLAAPRRLGGALIFDNSRLAGARVNYNARTECRVTHAEMAELEQLLATPAKYFT